MYTFFLQQLPYEMVGTEQDGPLPKGFILGVYYEDDKPDVRNQRQCGSCFSFSAAESLSSVYSALQYKMNNKSSHLTFSNQFMMDCYPIPTGPVEDATAIAGGCYGGDQWFVFDFIIESGGVVPLDLTYPYAGVPGTCR